MRAFLFLILLVAGGGVGYFVLTSGGPQGAAAQPPKMIAYIVAARPLPAGTLVRDSDLAVKSVPVDLMPPRAIGDSSEARDSLRGALVPHYVDVGAPITLADVLRPRDRGFLASVLTPGLRAVSIGVDAISGVAGLVSPGDRVDVLLTQEADPTAAVNAKHVMSSTVLRDVRVIAVDQQIVQGATAEGAGHVARTVSLEVSPDQAQLVAVAEKLGVLSLSIRPLTDKPAEAIAEHPVFGSQIAPQPTAPDVHQVTTMHVIEGEKRTEVSFQ